MKKVARLTLSDIDHQISALHTEFVRFRNGTRDEVNATVDSCLHRLAKGGMEANGHLIRCIDGLAARLERLELRGLAIEARQSAVEAKIDEMLDLLKQPKRNYV